MAISEPKAKNPFVAIFTKLFILAGVSLILYFFAETLVIDLIRTFIRLIVWMVGY